MEYQFRGSRSMISASCEGYEVLVQVYLGSSKSSLDYIVYWGYIGAIWG